MEGQGDIEQEDIDLVTDRFQMMPAIDMPQINRVAGEWYKATPPLCRQWSHISPLDIFGRTVVKNLPENIKVGVINVAVGGGSIDIFDEDKCEEYIAREYHHFVCHPLFLIFELWISLPFTVISCQELLMVYLR